MQLADAIFIYKQLQKFSWL